MSDVLRGKNTVDNSNADDYADKIGRFVRTKYPEGDCGGLIQRYIKKYY